MENLAGYQSKMRIKRLYDISSQSKSRSHYSVLPAPAKMNTSRALNIFVPKSIIAVVLMQYS